MARLDLVVAAVLAVGCGGKDGAAPDGPPGVDSPIAIDARIDSPPGFCPPNLVSSWSGDNVFTDTKGLNPGTPIGTVPFATGEVGSGFQISANNFVEVSDSSSLDLTTQITIEGWINLTAANLNNRILDKINAGGGDGYLLDVNVDVSNLLRLRMIIGLVGGTTVHALTQSNGSVPTNAFVHVAGTYDGASTHLYVDGAEVGVLSNTTGAIGTSALPLRLGAASDGGGAFGGVLDEVGLFSRALSGTEIAAIHDAGPSGRCR